MLRYLPILLLLVMCACTAPQRVSNVSRAGGCEEPFDPARDYFPDKVDFRHAAGVRIEYHKHYKLMTIHPGGVGKRVFRYVLLQCGTPKPNVEADAVVTIPVRRIVLTAAVFEGVVELLGLHNTLIAVGDYDRVVMPGVRKMVKERRLPQVGCCSHTNIEQVMALKPDALFNHYFENELSAREEALTQAGVPSIFLAQQPEPTMLGTAEWSKAFAAFFNREGDAERNFQTAERAYNELAAKARRAVPRPKVLFSMPDRDSWSIAGRKNRSTRDSKMWNIAGVRPTGILSFGLIRTSIGFHSAEALLRRGYIQDGHVTPGEAVGVVFFLSVRMIGVSGRTLAMSGPWRLPRALYGFL